MVGNVHWATRSRDKSRDVEYHSRRVFHHFTRGINRKDFLRCCDQARRFRRHFQDVREDILAKLRKLRVPSPKPRSYSNFNPEHLKTLCREKKLPVSGNKAELVKRLKHHDAEQAIASTPVTPSPSVSQDSESNASSISQEKIHYSFSRTRDELDEEPSQEPRHSKRRKPQ
jgi:hypothetical protein